MAIVGVAIVGVAIVGVAIVGVAMVWPYTRCGHIVGVATVGVAVLDVDVAVVGVAMYVLGTAYAAEHAVAPSPAAAEVPHPFRRRHVAGDDRHLFG